jgi:hypothetical protein
MGSGNEQSAAATTTSSSNNNSLPVGMHPMSIDDARYLISLYISSHPVTVGKVNANASAVDMQQCPFWAVCDEPTSPLLGAWCERKGSVVTLKVGCPENAPASSKGSMSMDALIERYQTNKRADSTSTTSSVASVNKHAHAVYDMLGSINDPNGTGTLHGFVFVWLLLFGVGSNVRAMLV